MPVEIKKYEGCGYLAAEGYRDHLESELLQKASAAAEKNIYNNLILLKAPPVSAYWAKTVMLNPMFITFETIAEAAKQLALIQRNWALYPFNCFRRASLIKEKLPYIGEKPKKFPCNLPRTPMGLWTLLDEHTMLASAETTSFLPAGEVTLIEDHINPPSRAYLKLQEALLRCGEFPQAGERCLDAGACPGGWSWVLAQLGAEITAVDRAELADSLMKNPLITFIKHDAFTLKQEELGVFDWVFSDVICYPSRLLEWVHLWLGSSSVPRMICTIKMQGEPDWAVIEQFASIPGSEVVHLHYNKHELTWIYMGNS